MFVYLFVVLMILVHLCSYLILYIGGAFAAINPWFGSFGSFPWAGERKGHPREGVADTSLALTPANAWCEGSQCTTVKSGDKVERHSRGHPHDLRGKLEITNNIYIYIYKITHKQKHRSQHI